MTKGEAESILRRNNYCPTHGIPMDKHKQQGYGWADDFYKYYTCSLCEQARKNATAAELREALKKLGLSYPA